MFQKSRAAIACHLSNVHCRDWVRLFKHNVQPISAFSFGKIFQLEVAGVQNRSSDLKLNKL